MMMLQILKQKAMLIATGVTLFLLVLILVCILHPGIPAGVSAPLAVVAGIALVISTGLGAMIQSRLLQEQDKIRYYDQLSGLGNQHLLLRDLARMKQRDGRAFVLMRLNGFNWLNILFGMKRGAEMICRLSPLMREFAASCGGVAYRVSLDHYAMLIEVPPDQKALQQLFDRFFASLEEIQVQDRHISYSYHYTFAYAACRMSNQLTPPEADSHLLTSVAAAVIQIEGDTYTSGVILGSENTPDWEQQKLLESSIEQAWRDREFVPYYQMVYDIDTGRPVGAELLTRWIFPGRGLIPPSDFVPVMEEKGMIMDLDLYMLEEACKKIKKWIDDELVTVPLSVNISRLNIHRTNFVELLIDVVERYDIPPVLIELELSEAVLLFEKTDAFIELMERLHRYGFTLSMDHFAESDFSSINLLRSLEVDVVKISPSFFAEAEDSERKRIFTTCALEMFRKMKIKVVAANVETEEQLALCRRFGCELAQGFYYSRPIPNEEFEKQIF